MDWLVTDDWRTVFYPSVPLLELFVRASCLYLGLFSLLRMALRRQLGGIGTTDLLVVVLIATTAHNAMGTQHKSVADALMMAATMVFWNLVLQYTSQHSAWIARLLHPPAITLVKNGRFNRQAMDRELITEDEILTQMRQQGIDDVKRIARASLEGDGKISILTHDRKPHRKPREVRGG